MGWARWELRPGSAEEAGEARSGHSAVLLDEPPSPRVVIYGGICDKRFLGDLSVYNVSDGSWSRPEKQPELGPGERAFHCAVKLGRYMYVLCGRTNNRQKHNDVWRLDVDSWAWEEVHTHGSELIVARDFASAVAVGDKHILLYGGHTGSKWLNTLHMLDLETCTWAALQVSGSPAPTPRSAHTCICINNNQLVVFGGQGQNGAILGDLWTLNGLDAKGEESLSWVRQPLHNNSLGPRAGCSGVEIDNAVLLFGGHSEYSSWLARHQDLYLNDMALLKMDTWRWEGVDAQVEGGPGELPPPRAYHSLTPLPDGTLLMFGGFNGKVTFRDIWTLRVHPTTAMPDEAGTSKAVTPAENATIGSDNSESEGNRAAQTGGTMGSGVVSVASHVGSGVGNMFRALGTIGQIGGSLSSSTLQALGRTVTLTSTSKQPNPSTDPSADEVVVSLDTNNPILFGKNQIGSGPPEPCGKDGTSGWSGDSHDGDFEDLGALRTHLSFCNSETITVSDVPNLFKDYRRLVEGSANVLSSIQRPLVPNHTTKGNRFRFYHLDVDSLRMDDVSALLAEYHELLEACKVTRLPT